jgi:multiple sugar transport system permease protein
MIITPVVVAIMWKFILWPAWGLLAYILGNFGVPPIDWFSPQLALVSILITEIWQWTPFVFLVILSGLVALPIQPFEAARIDGAGKWQTFRSITLPYLMPTITVALLFRLMDGLKIFEPIYVLTAGGPGTTTYSITYYIYQEYMRFSHPGLGSAASYLMLIVVVLIVSIYFKYVYQRS